MINKNRADGKRNGYRPLKYLVFGGILVAITLSLYWVLGIMYQNNVSDMKNVFSQASQKILLPEGGREHWPATVTHGPSLLESFCVDTNCPQVEAYWYVPLTKSGYNDFEAKLVGYIKNDTAFSKHSDWHVQIYPAEVSKADINELPVTTEGRTWQGVHLFLYR